MKKSVALLSILVFTVFSLASVQKVSAASTSVAASAQITNINESQYEKI